MDRRKFSYAIAVVLALTCLLYVGWQQHVEAVTRETYERLEIFSDVLKKVKDHYVEEVDDEKLIYGAIQGMISDLDPHSSFLPPKSNEDMEIAIKGSFEGLGIEIAIRDGILTVISPIEGTPAFEAGIEAGDKVLRIDEESTQNMTLFDAVEKLRGPKGTRVKLFILREGVDQPMEITVARAVIRIPSVRAEVLEAGYPYIRIASFHARTTADLEENMKRLAKEEGGVRGLILDLRNNPGGLMDQAVGVSDLFLESGLIVYTRGRQEGSETRFEAQPQGSYVGFPMVVLVNSGSASASEIVAGALQDHKRAVVLGTQTFGKGSVQTIFQLADGSGLRLTTALYYTPNGRSIQAKGITPDIVVEAGEIVQNSIPPSLREENLQGHIETQGNAQKVEENPMLADVQVRRALDYLRSWNLFKGERTGL
ncbi:MAG: S41 family peptidase [Deltaproteobacteria bacterium]|nr:S41 family peptidase [Deltaproteobacteria bacterium]